MGRSWLRERISTAWPWLPRMPRRFERSLDGNTKEDAIDDRSPRTSRIGPRSSADMRLYPLCGIQNLGRDQSLKSLRVPSSTPR